MRQVSMQMAKERNPLLFRAQIHVRQNCTGLSQCFKPKIFGCNLPFRVWNSWKTQFYHEEPYKSFEQKIFSALSTTSVHEGRSSRPTKCLYYCETISGISSSHDKFFADISFYKTWSFRVCDRRRLWNCILSEAMACFVGIIQIYTDQTATTLIANFTVANLVHFVLQSFSDEFRRYLINQVLTLAGRLLVSTLESSNGQDKVDLDWKMFFLALFF